MWRIHTRDVAQVTETVTHLQNIFVERNLILWKAPNVLAFLQSAALG